MYVSVVLSFKVEEKALLFSFIHGGVILRSFRRLRSVDSLILTLGLLFTWLENLKGAHE